MDKVNELTLPVCFTFCPLHLNNFDISPDKCMTYIEENISFCWKLFPSCLIITVYLHVYAFAQWASVTYYKETIQLNQYPQFVPLLLTNVPEARVGRRKNPAFRKLKISPHASHRYFYIVTRIIHMQIAGTSLVGGKFDRKK